MTIPRITVAVAKALAEIGPMSAAELVPVTGLTRDAIKGAISRLRIKGDVHIGEYRRQDTGRSGQMVPIYTLDRLRDASRLAPITNKEASKAYYHRHRAVISARRYPDYHKSFGVWAGLL